MVGRRRNQGHARHGKTQAGNQRVDLAARQLSAFTGLGTLGDFDLQHFRIHQIVRRYSEATRGHLFDLGTFVGAETGRVFAAFAGVGASAQAVHALRQRFMCFR